MSKLDVWYREHKKYAEKMKLDPLPRHIYEQYLSGETDPNSIANATLRARVQKDIRTYSQN